MKARSGACNPQAFNRRRDTRGYFSGLGNRQHADSSAVLTVILEPHLAVNFRKERVVLAHPDIESRLEAAALLPHEDRSAGDDVAVVALDAEPLCVAVATVT